MKSLQVGLALTALGLAYWLGVRQTAAPVQPQSSESVGATEQRDMRRTAPRRLATSSVDTAQDLASAPTHLEPQLARLLTPSSEWGSWKHDDARALANIARICGRDRQQLAIHLIQNGRLTRALACYRLMTPIVSTATTDLDDTRHQLFEHKFRTGDFVEVPLGLKPGTEEFRSRFGISRLAVVHSKAVATDERTTRLVAWIEPDELPAAEVLQSESRHLKQWRQTALLALIDSPNQATPR